MIRNWVKCYVCGTVHDYWKGHTCTKHSEQFLRDVLQAAIVRTRHESWQNRQKQHEAGLRRMAERLEKWADWRFEVQLTREQSLDAAMSLLGAYNQKDR